jgi:hypothetical protein
MSERSTSKQGAPAEPREGAGILASLPNTRPQRPSARRTRAAATSAPSAKSESGPKPVFGRSTGPRPSAPSAATSKVNAASRTKASSKAKTRKAAVKPNGAAKIAKSNGRPSRPPKPVPTPAPRQGFEVGSEIEQGLAVGPPSSIELATSVVGLLGEVAQAGAASGGRLLKGAFSRLQGR